MALYISNALAAIAMAAVVTDLVTKDDADAAVAGCALFALFVCNTVAQGRLP